METKVETTAQHFDLRGEEKKTDGFTVLGFRA